MINKKTFVLQSDLTQTIDNLISYFECNIQEGVTKIDKLDIKELEDSIKRADIHVRSELHYLRDFMNLEKVDMIYLDNYIQRIISERLQTDASVIFFKHFTGKF